MSFSSDVKEELSKLNTFNRENLVEAELLGYMLSQNSQDSGESIEFITENEIII